MVEFEVAMSAEGRLLQLSGIPGLGRQQLCRRQDNSEVAHSIIMKAAGGLLLHPHEDEVMCGCRWYVSGTWTLPTRPCTSSHRRS